MGEIGRACSTHGEMRHAFKILVGKSEGNSPLGRSRHRYENNIKMHLKKNGMWMCGLNSIGSWYGSVVGSYEESRWPAGYTKAGNLL